jgi:hypothetical protein
MKQFILLFTTISIFTSCLNTKESNQTNQKQPFFLADSLFIRNLKVDTTTLIKKVNSSEYGRNEQQYSFLKEKARYFEVKRIELENHAFGRIVTVDFPNTTTDGIFNILFFVTYDQNGKEIDGIRLAKYESVSDVFSLETGVVQGNSIEIERYYSTIDFNEKVNESFTITRNGDIEKITNGNNGL